MRITLTTAIGLVLLPSCSPRKEASPAAAAVSHDSAPAGPVVDSLPPAPPPTPTRPAATPAPKALKPAQRAARPPSTSPPARPRPKIEAAVDTPPPPLRDPYHPAPRDTLDNETYQGWKQFELNCSRCHGDYAVGTSFAPALVVSLKEGGTIPTKETFMTTVCAGRPDKGMPAWCSLGLEIGKIEEIYLYVKGRADGKIAIGRPALRE